jgi:hypothetical protein
VTERTNGTLTTCSTGMLLPGSGDNHEQPPAGTQLRQRSIEIRPERIQLRGGEQSVLEVAYNGKRSSFVLLASRLGAASVALSNWSTHLNAGPLDDGVDRYQGVRFVQYLAA